MLEPTLNDGQAYVPGRSEDTARHLMELAEKAGLDASVVSTTSHGYIVPEELVHGEKGLDAKTTFDPSEHSVAEVLEYLDGVDETERQRVLDAEASSDKPRKGLLKEGDK